MKKINSKWCNKVVPSGEICPFSLFFLNHRIVYILDKTEIIPNTLNVVSVVLFMYHKFDY